MAFTDIGLYIAQKEAFLQAWGNHVVESLRLHVGNYAKLPPTCRVKDAASARAKQIRKGYADPILEMTDLVGGRFVVLTSADLSPVRQWVEENHAWSVKKSRDYDDEVLKDPKLFDYQSVHYEIRPRVSLDLPIGRIETDMCCELQVRTLLQHAYAEMLHDNVYKPSGSVPSRAERLLARSMALMETTDELFCKAIAAIEDANRSVTTLISDAGRIAAVASSPVGLDMARLLAAEFRTDIEGYHSTELDGFVAEHAFVLDRLSKRKSGLFEFREVALMTYWLIDKLENKVLEKWPFANCRSDVETIFSDLGISDE